MEERCVGIELSAPASCADVDDQDIESLLAGLHSGGSDTQRTHRRDCVITRCLPIADRIAYRFAGRGEPVDDLVQVARVGLIKAVDRYDQDKGRFLPFAVPTITGEVKRYFRDATWSVRVPREVKETQMRNRAAFSDLAQRLRRMPTSAEVAEELGVDHCVLAESESASSAYHPISLDAPIAGGEGGSETVGSAYGAEDSQYTNIEEMMVVREAIADLDPRRRAILGMRFLDCLTQSEIAKRLEVSQVQVCRLLNSAIERLRQQVICHLPAVTCLVYPIGMHLW